MTLSTAHLPSQVLIWNLDIGEPVKMIDCHTDVILCLSFNTDGSLLTTTCKDKKLRVIEPRSGRVLQVEPFVLLKGVGGTGVCGGMALCWGPASHPSYLQTSLSAQGHSQPVGTLLCYGQ